MKLGEVLAALTSLARTGWMLRGVPHSLAENVAEHLFASALIAYEIAVEASKKGLPVNPEKAAVIALVHDLAEALIGDISKRAELTGKEEVEERAYNNLQVSKEMKALYMEYKEQTLEGSIAKIADNIATYWKAKRYFKAGYTEVEDIMTSSLKTAIETAGKKKIKEIVEDIVSRIETSTT